MQILEEQHDMVIASWRPWSPVFSRRVEKKKQKKKQHTDLYVFQGIVKVGAVDADQHKSLGGQYGVRGFPTIKIFGANKNKPEEYQGISEICADL